LSPDYLPWNGLCELVRSEPQLLRLRVALWERIFSPIVPWVLSAMVFPVVVRQGEGGTFLRAGGIALGVCLLYFLVEGVLRQTGGQGYLPPWLSVALAPLLFAAAGGLMLRRVE
jgi:lipopolysaccharide export LptBFGC system permease protein LptF